MASRLRIHTNYYWKIFKINVKLRQRLTRLWIGGKLVKLAFWVSSDLRNEMGYE